jgi:hypothetical protein
VLPLITKYLLQHKRVSIPHVGSFELKTRPPQQDFAANQVLAPVFITEYSSVDEVPDHQFRYFSQVRGHDKESVEQELLVFGQRLKETIQRRSLNWKGFGVLEAEDQGIVFQPQEIRLGSLQPVPAARVIRPSAQHRVLVGEQDLSSKQANDILQQPAAAPPKRSWADLIGWIVLALAVLAIAFLLYRHSFSPTSGGLKKRVNSFEIEASGL